MKEIKIYGNGVDHVFNFPEKLEEVDVHYLEAVTENVKLADDYVLVGVIYRQNLNEFTTTNKSQKNATTMAVPVMVKAGISTNTFINNLKLGDKLIVSGSDLAMGYHVTCPLNSLSGARLAALMRDENVRSRNKMLYTEFLSTTVYMVEFKIIPACTVHAVVGDTDKTVVDNYYKAVKTTADKE